MHILAMSGPKKKCIEDEQIEFKMVFFLKLFFMNRTVLPLSIESKQTKKK